MAVNTGSDPDGSRVGPGKEVELGPPTLNHETNVESQHKGDRNEIGKVVAIKGDLFEDQFS